MRAVDAIAKKKRGEELSPEEMAKFLTSYLEGQITDYQMAAWLMAVCFQGMTEKETREWTRLMWKSGASLPRKTRNDFWIDKHSTGGVGDKTSLLLVPLLLTASERAIGERKVKLPMISGRGLGHTGGTLDKLESVPGFLCRKTLEEASRLIEERGFFMIGQSEEIAPADRRIYALRDATATVDSVPLIVSSILSKKLAESIDGIVFDVKVGAGAFMKTPKEARKLASVLVSTSRLEGLRAVALITGMEEPLGKNIGNALEVQECWEFLQGFQEPKMKTLVIELGAWMLRLASSESISIADCRNEFEASLTSPRAQELFVQMFENQGGRWREFESSLKGSSSTHQELEVRASATGYVTACNALKMGEWVRQEGGGRQKTTDPIDPFVGIKLIKKVGEPVKEGELLALAVVKKNRSSEEVIAPLKSAFQVGDVFEKGSPIVFEVIQ